ncbi:MAG TPA: tyrosinase family protein [Vicinamibacterales bacterium]|nr:tyrosinase family protein [Vicinamibacterales bacterium]
MQRTRKNVWELGKDWADDILWYARGVAELKKLAIADRGSWNFYAAMHGIDPQLWAQLGVITTTTPMPPGSDVKRFWQQCQHGSWYFLPWHRGYLIAFEATVQAAITKAGGPATWALPYWNYFKPHQFKLPTAFASPDWPDGKGTNPLFVKERYGPNNDGKVFVVLSDVNLKALTDPDFTGTSSGSRGFGGIDTGFEHGGSMHGRLEQQPHDQVHGLVGGGDQTTQLPGLMSDPDTAGLDPIFWLHHANIDRLWEVWRRNPATNANPADKKWLKGPASLGQRAFSMPMPGGKTWDYTPADMADLSKLDYTYDDLAPAVKAPHAPRLTHLGMPAPMAAAVEGAGVPTGKNVELVGASRAAVVVSGTGTKTSVHLDTAARRKVAASLAATPTMTRESVAAGGGPDRVFLNLENVRGTSDATVLRLYLDAAGAPDPANRAEKLAASASLFGLRKASRTDAGHSGDGLSLSFDVTDAIDALHLAHTLDVESLDVAIVPSNPLPDRTQITIGRVSLYRQGR